MRYEIDLTTGETVEHEDAPATPEPPLTPLEKLAALDAENPITPRNLRQMAMLMAEGFKQVTGGALDISQIPGVRDAYVVEAKADALRAQL